MPNFSSLAGLEVAEKFLWGWGGVGWGGLHSHFHVKPNRCVVLCCVGVGVLTTYHHRSGTSDQDLWPHIGVPSDTQQIAPAV